MVYFFYKCYYVFFLHYCKFKNDVPWFSAITAIAAAVAMLLLVFYFMLEDIFGLRGTIFFPDLDGLRPVGRKGRQALFIIPFITTIWFIIKYIILNKAKASKEDGRSEIYSFEPTKRDKIICWVFALISCCTIFILVGIKALLGHYS